MLVCFGLGVFFENFNFYSKVFREEVSKFQKTLNEKELEADEKLQKMLLLISQKNNVELTSFDNYSKEDGYFLFEGNVLIFWSSNAFDVTSVNVGALCDGQIVTLPNAICECRIKSHESFTAVALIKLKNAYSYENDYLRNEFVEDFDLDSRVTIDKGASSDEFSIFSIDGKYLFTLNQNAKEVPPSSVYISCFFWILAFLLFLYSYIRQDWFWGSRICKLKYFVAITLVYFLLACLFFFFGYPKNLFNAELFALVESSFGLIFPSLGHLLFITLFLLASTSVFAHKIIIPELKSSERLFLWLGVTQLLSVIYFAVVYVIFFDLLKHSANNIALISVQDLNGLNFLTFFLIGCWFLSFVLFRNRCVMALKRVINVWCFLLSDVLVLIFLLPIGILNHHLLYVALFYFALCAVVDVARYRSESYFSYNALVLIVFFCANFIVFECFVNNYNDKLSRYRLLSSSVFDKKNVSYDFFAERVLVSVNKAIADDNNIKRYLSFGNVPNHRLTTYLNKFYFNEISQLYEIKSYIENKNLKEYYKSRYRDTYSHCEKVEKTNFYNTYFANQSFVYFGRFDYVLYNGDIATIYIEIYPKNRLRYSYPDLLLEEQGLLPTHISVAKYFNGQLVSSLGEYKFQEMDEWIPIRKDVFFAKNRMFYLFSPRENEQIVISEKDYPLWLSYLLFLSYSFLFYIIVSLSCYSIWRKMHNVKSSSSIFNHLFRSLIIFFVVGITIVFVFISLSIINNVHEQSQKDIQMKLQYAQEMLYGVLGERESLSGQMTELAFFLQNLSVRLETDIHLYKPTGELIATSRPIIFFSGLTSRLMNPHVYFREEESQSVVFEQIGNLHYAALYDVLKNKNGQVLAYIAVPEFGQIRELQYKLFNFLSIVINLYLILILLSIVVSFLLARRIGLPIKKLEEKLQTIRIGKKNEKIVYNSDDSDEIGKLISQYNAMVDDLAYSAEMLAQKERELVWKQMARQIAHEIKNPLTPMKLTVQQLQRLKKNNPEKFDSYFSKSANVLIEQIENLSKIASSFSNFATMPEMKPLKIDLMERLVSIVELFRNNYQNTEIEIKNDAENTFIMADPVQMTQVFNNLLRNAIQAIPMERAGKIEIRLKNVENWLVVQVEDNGCGISDEIKEKMFLPNFTTKSSGMGLGLAIVKNIINMSNGDISYTSVEGEGTLISLRFPIVV